MQKTTAYIPDALKTALARNARETGLNKTELIRYGIEFAVERRESPSPTIPIFASTDPTFEEQVDRHLKGFGTL